MKDQRLCGAPGLRGRATATATALALTAYVVQGVAYGQPSTMTALATPEEHQRGEEQTFLTFPEWYLVYAPEEFARFLERDGQPSKFPYLRQVGQYWEAYRTVNARTEGRYPANSEYQVMLWVIGVSTTVEYGLREVYERWVGRFFEHTRSAAPTPEELLAADVAQEYVDVILDRPWYEYDFVGALARLWRDTPLWGRDMLRKWERRYALTSEWAAKAIYAKLIKFANESTYAPAAPVTTAWVAAFPEERVSQLDGATVLARNNQGALLLAVPRYAAFKHSADYIAAQGGRFVEIAGNRDAITLCALVPPEWQPPSANTRIMLRQPLYTEPQHERILAETPVNELADLLRALSEQGHRVEHVFDY